MINRHRLPSDDMPAEYTIYDEILRRKLDESVSKSFYEACNRILRALLSECEWKITTKPPIMRLVINCPDMENYWYILSAIVEIARKFEMFSDSKARVCIFPPKEYGGPFDMRVGEVFLYKDFL